MILFPPFVLDLRSGQLMRGSAAIPMRPKTWAVLRYLAERPGLLITRDELFRALWAEVVAGDDTLTKSIGEIRSALGDDPKNPRFIETVHRRGFRFVAASRQEVQDGAAAAHIDEPPADASEAPFVGRTAELNALEACFRRSCGGRRQVVFVTGEPGVGKTTLVDTFTARLSARPELDSVLIATGCSVEQSGAGEAYLPVLDAIERIGRQARDDRFVPLLRRFAPTWLAQIPWLVAPEDQHALEGLVEVRAHRMLRELCAFIEVFTQAQPLVLILEDLHWSDPATVELISMVAQRKEAARLLVIGTYRPAAVVVENHPLLSATQTLRQRKQCVEVHLDDLSQPEVQTYLGRRFPGCAQEEELASMIHAQTDGSPLFMTAVLDELVARGWLVDTAPGWGLTVPLARANLGVPSDLRKMILGQFESLGPGEQSLIEAASVVGLEWVVPVLAGALRIDADESETICERMARTHRFLRSTGAQDWADRSFATRYGFLHSLHRQVVYEAIPERRRRKLHQCVGESIETAWGTDTEEVAAELAVHFEHSRDAVRAVKYLSLAAQRALRRFAAREAAAYLERALLALSRLPASPERQRQELDVRFQLGSVLGQLHGYAADPAWENYREVCRVCRDVGTPDELYRALQALWPSQASRAETDAIATARELCDLAHNTADEETRAQAQVILARTLFWEGKWPEAHERLQSVLGFWDEEPGSMDGFAMLEPPGIAVHFYSAVLLGLLGYPERLRAGVRKALAAAERVAHPFVLAGSYLHAAYILHLCGDLDDVERCAKQSIAVADEHGFPFWSAMATALCGWVRMRRGDAESGAEMIRAGLDQQRSTGATVLCSHLLAFLAEAQLARNDVAAGIEAVEEGLALCRSTLDRVFESELWRIKGELLLAVCESKAVQANARGHDSPDLRLAEECFDRALTVARERGARLFELRAATSLAGLRRAQGRGPEGYKLLAAVHEWFPAEYATLDLQASRSLLDALS